MCDDYGNLVESEGCCFPDKTRRDVPARRKVPRFQAVLRVLMRWYPKLFVVGCTIRYDVITIGGHLVRYL